MTEQEWLTSDDPAALLRYIAHPNPPSVKAMSERQMRLFAEACRDFMCPRARWSNPLKSTTDIRRAMYDLTHTASSTFQKECPMAVRADLLRDIVGNPFRPVTVEPAWLTWNDACIPALAAEIYEQRAWDRLPILADALEEAGCPQTTEQPCPECSPYANDPCPNCDGNKYFLIRGLNVTCQVCRSTGKFPPGYRPERDPASGRHEGGWTNCKTCNDRLRPTKGIVRVPHPLLAHLRGPGPHVRGCWAVDLLTGRS